jgi:hypothetical protein
VLFGGFCPETKPGARGIVTLSERYITQALTGGSQTIAKNNKGYMAKDHY